MTRPILSREDRERCPHARTVSINSKLPNSYNARQWCEACGSFLTWTELDDFQFVTNALAEGQPDPADQIDWPATEQADLADAEREGQGRLTL